MSIGTQVNFKRGTQSALNSILAKLKNSTGTVDEGSFYLTNDTDRLYFAQSSSSLVELNQYVRVVASTANLPTSSDPNLMDGDIYYIAQGNILAIYDSNYDTRWVQLNPDTNNVLDASASGLNISYSAANNKVTLTQNIVDSINGGNTHTVTTSAAIIGGSNVTISADNNTKEITISATDTDTTYAFDVAQGSGGDGTAKLNITPTVNGSAQASTVITFAGDGVDLSVDSSAKTITFKGSSGIDDVGLTFDSSGTLTVAIDAGNDTFSDAVTPIIQYGGTSSNPATVSAIFNSGTATLDVYTKSEVEAYVEAQRRSFDAMEYKGVIADASDAATKVVASAQAGWTYKVSQGFNNVNGVTAKSGDLVIAKGVDGSVTWDVVNAGDDQTIEGEASGNGISISDQDGVLAGIAVVGSSNAYGTISATASITGNYNTITVTHGPAGSGSAATFASATSDTTLSAATDSSGYSISIPTIVGISTDNAGHVTSLSTVTYQVVDTHANISVANAGVNIDTNNNYATIATTVMDTDGQSDDASFTIGSDNLEISGSNSTQAGDDGVIKINLVWGSFS